MEHKWVKAQLQGEWGRAVWAESVVLMAHWVVRWLEWGLLFACGLSVWPAGGEEPIGWRWGILLLALLADWLLLSPCLFHRDTLYYSLHRSNAVAPSRWMRYRRALWWRLQLWGRRLWYSLLLWTPGITLLAVGESERLAAIRQGTPARVAGLLLIGGVLLLLIGGAVVEWRMLFTRAAPFYLARGWAVTPAFARSRQVMQGHTGRYLSFLLHHGWRIPMGWLLLSGLYLWPLFRVGEAALIRQYALSVTDTAVW